MGTDWHSFDVEKFVTNLGRLKRNRDNVPLEVLRTRYAKPYGELCREIDEDTEKCWRAVCYGSMHIDYSDQEGVAEMQARIEGIVEAERARGSFRRLHDIAHEEQSFERILEHIGSEIFPRIWFDGYGPYWLRHVTRDGASFRCSLLGDGWHWMEAWGSWADKDENAVTIMLPPTEELIRKEKEMWKR